MTCVSTWHVKEMTENPLDLGNKVRIVLQELMREAHGITAYLALNRQQLLYQLQDCRMDTQETNVPAPDEAFWGSILVRPNSLL